MTRTMVPRFKILLDYHNKVPELKKEDTTWVPNDWADYMDPNAMTTLLGDPICNIEDEEYWEACQHALKRPYELRANDEDEEGGVAPGDDEVGSDDKSDSSSDSGHDDDDNSADSEDNSSRSYDSPYSGDDWGEPFSDREDEDVDLFYEEYDSDVDYYDQDIEDNAEANRYDKHGREVPELGSYYDSEPSSPTIKEEDDIDARLAALDQKLMVHSLRIMVLESAKCSDEGEGEGEPKHLLQPTNLGNKSKHELFDEWMDSIERLNAFETVKPTDMEIEEETIDDMDVDPAVWEGAAHPMEDSMRKIKIVKSITFSKKIKTVEPVTPAKNIVSIPIESVSVSVSIPVKYFIIPVSSFEFIVVFINSFLVVSKKLFSHGNSLSFLVNNLIY
ncbi:hypothetical protein SO802_033854 [Lithocarpus litseifolius]|uniref:Uncharacterized protein n=1 Tax=Lithocarpus litseifolius TaxID=425828 RepID=A0AAW2BH62_9ROSI